MNRKDQEINPQDDAPSRPFARVAARELTPTEVDAIAGGKPSGTHATGPNGDDPSDPAF